MVTADRIRLALAVAGSALVGYGCWMHYRPAGFVAFGALMFLVAMIGSLRAKGG